MEAGGKQVGPRVAVPNRPHTGLPNEIWDLVVDYAVDFDTLKSLAVTCRAFLHRSRYHLFKRPYLKTFPNAELLVRALQTDPASRGFVKELLLDFSGVTIPTGPVAQHMLPMLPDLRSISIRIYNLYHRQFYTSLSPVSQTLDTLRLYYSKFEDFLDFGRILLALPRLSHLALHSVTFESIDLAKSHSDTELAAIRLSSLEYTDAGHARTAECLALWLRRTSSPQALRWLHIMLMFSTPTISNLIDVATRDSFTLIISNYWMEDDLRLPNASVRSLRTTIASHRLSAVVELLRSLPPGILEDFSLRVTWNVSYQIFEDVQTSTLDRTTFAELASLDGVLSQSQFSSLRRLHIQCSIYSSDSPQPSLPVHLSRDQILKDLLPNVDPRLWTDDFGDLFHVEPARLSVFYK